VGIKNIFNQTFISKAPNPKEEALYKRVLDEMKSGTRRTGIMAKALADSLGDKDKAESLYIKYRMQTIADEDKNEAKLFIETQKIAEEHAAGDLKLEEINEKAVSKRLYTGEMPDPDLVIRTSGEERISNFLLWQMAYSELYFSDVFWPSFQKKDLLKAIRTFQERRRRFGE
jgi:tritrans,polycis-undecaprenyl-diphosphate synthase [geranylgeranyl-diphosphate specific]